IVISVNNRNAVIDLPGCSWNGSASLDSIVEAGNDAKHVIAVRILERRHVTGAGLIASVSRNYRTGSGRQLNSARGQPRTSQADVLGQQFKGGPHVLLQFGTLCDDEGGVHTRLEKRSEGRHYH